MSTIHIIDNNITAYTKGAVDEMLPLCDSILTENGIRPLTNKDKEDIKIFVLICHLKLYVYLVLQKNTKRYSF